MATPDDATPEGMAAAMESAMLGQLAPEGTEPPAETPAPEPTALEKFMAEQNLTQDQALALLNTRKEEQEAEQQQQRQAEIEELALQKAQQELLPQRYAQAIQEMMQDPTFRQGLKQQLARYEAPGLPTPPDGENEDPSLALLRRTVAQSEAQAQRIAQLEAMVKQSQFVQAAVAHDNQIGEQFTRFVRSNPAAAQVQDDLAADLAEAVRSNRNAFAQPQVAVKRFLDARLQRFNAVSQRLAQTQKSPPPPGRAGGGGVPGKAIQPLTTTKSSDMARLVLAAMNAAGGE